MGLILMTKKKCLKILEAERNYLLTEYHYFEEASDNPNQLNELNYLSGRIKGVETAISVLKGNKPPFSS